MTPRRAAVGATVRLAVSVTVMQVNEDRSEDPVDGEVAAALAGPAGQFSSMVTWLDDDLGGAGGRPSGSRGPGEPERGILGRSEAERT